jgi:hypothetical protein
MRKFRQPGLCDAALDVVILAAGMWLILSSVTDLFK